jgi:hypothetical protein
MTLERDRRQHSPHDKLKESGRDKEAKERLTDADTINIGGLSMISEGEVSSSDTVSQIGVSADDFLPTFIWVVLTSNVPKLQSNCEYIQAFHNPNRMMTKAGYCFVSLRSAIEFILVADPSSLSVDPKEFYKYLHRAEKELNAGIF